MPSLLREPEADRRRVEAFKRLGTSVLPVDRPNRTQKRRLIFGTLRLHGADLTTQAHRIRKANRRAARRVAKQARKVNRGIYTG